MLELNSKDFKKDIKIALTHLLENWKQKIKAKK